MRSTGRFDMEKKDYEKIADTLRYCMPSKIAKPRGYNARLEMWEGVVVEMCKMLADENPAFNRTKFLMRVSGSADGKE